MNIWSVIIGVGLTFYALFTISLVMTWRKKAPKPQAFETDVERAVHIVRFDAGDVKSFRVIEEASENGLTMASVSIEMSDEGEVQC